MCSNVLVELAQSSCPLQIGLQGGSALATGDGVEAVVFPGLAFEYGSQGDLPAQGRAHLVLLCVKSCPDVRTLLAWIDCLIRWRKARMAFQCCRSLATSGCEPPVVALDS